MRRAKFLLLSALLLVLALSAGLAWVASRESTLQWVLGHVSESTGGRLRFDGVRGSLLGAIDIEHVRFAGPALEVDAARTSLRLSLLPLLIGDLVVDRLAAASIAVQHTASDKPPQVPQDLTLPLAVRIRALDVTQLSIRSGTSQVALTQLRARLDSDGARHRLVLEHLASPWGTASASADLSGRTPFALTGTARFDPIASARLPSVRGAVSGDLLQLKATFTGEAPWIAANATAALQPFAPAVLSSLVLDLARFDPHALDAVLPAAAVTGTLQARAGEGKQLVGSVQLTNTSAGPLSADRLPLREATGEFSTDWTRLQFTALELGLARGAPLTGEATLSRAGIAAQLRTRGLDLNAIHVRLAPTQLTGTLALMLDARTQELQARLADQRYRYEADLARENQRLHIRKALVRADGGSIAAQGRLDLTGKFAFAGQLRLDRLNPAAFGAFPAARLNGTGEASGWLRPAWQTRLKLALTQSNWRGEPLSGDIETDLIDQRFWNSRGRLRLGANDARFHGGLGAPEDRLDLDFRLRRLEQLLPEWRGALTGRAQLAGKWRYPSLRIDAGGSGLRGPNRLRIGNLQLNASAAPRLDAPLRVQAEAGNAAFGDLAADTLSLQADGTGRQHRARLSVQGTQLALKTALSGGLEDAARWSGRIEQLEVTQPLPLRLETPATLRVAKNGVEFGAARLSSGDGHVTVTQLSIAPGAIRTNGAFGGLPLAAFKPFAPSAGTQTTMQTTMLLAGNWRIDADRQLNGFVHVQRESGDLLIDGEPVLGTPLTEARLTLSARDDQLGLDASAAARSVAHLRATLSTQAVKRGSAWVVPAAAPITLDASANLARLDWLGPLIHPSLVTKGRIRATARGRGTYGSPVLEGRIVGSELSVSEPASGARLSNGTLQAHFSDERLVLEGLRMEGKTGALTATGEAVFRGEPDLRLTFQARQLGLLDRPNWDINADTDGTLTANRREARLEARIKVNRARVNIPERGAPTLSEDVVIAGRTETAPQKSGSRVALDVSVDLGDDFRLRTIERPGLAAQALPIYQNRLDAKLGGSLHIRSDESGAPSATGSVRVVDGTYTFLGKRLEIQRGTLRFDGPIGNPALDILAMNEQFQVKVGVSVTGTVLNPHARLVSDPDVPEPEKLSWLLFGRGGQTVDGSLAGRAAGGIGVAGFGFQLSEKLYVGYEQGVAGTSNLMTLYSKLTDRLSVEARTGDESALRLFYTFELRQ